MIERSSPRATHLPGEVGIWLFVLGDLIMFTALFAIFLVYRANEPPVFSRGHLQLSQALGLLNTALMLTSSWFVVSANRVVRSGSGGHARTFLRCAIVCGVMFGAVKYVEWSAKIAQGVTPQTDNFFMFYFTLTGIHLVHVVIGTVVLTLLSKVDYRAVELGSTELRNLESGATFWHLVDLLWIVLFALLYLMP